jgi:hypothetical protein
VDLVYVAVWDWVWKPIGQVSLDIGSLYHNGEIDRGVLDDAVQKAAAPLFRESPTDSAHVFVYQGEQESLENLLELAQREYQARGPDVEAWPHGRRIKRTDPLRRPS